MKTVEAVALGELLVDFTENGMSDQGNQLLEANPGGAVCNVLAMLQQWEHATGFVGKVGKDGLGKMLREKVSSIGIDTSYLYEDTKVRTTLAFVHNYPDGDRDFSFYRNPGADMMLVEEEIPVDYIKVAKVFHFGTLSMTHPSVRNATQKALKIAKENGLLISFDPNLRESLWESLELARIQFGYGMKMCDILKISDNEIQWFTGEEDYDKGVVKLQQEYKIPLIVLSMGKDGSRAYYKDKRVEVPSYLQENTIETTGAGDTFCGNVLHFVLHYGIDNLDEQKLHEMLSYANAAASIITTRKGALCVMPTIQEIENLLKSRGQYEN